MSVNSTSPADLFGGEWEEINNTFLVAQGTSYTAGTSGGSITSGEPSNNTSGSTAITVAQMPAHNHGSKSLTGTWRFRDTASGSHDLILSSWGSASHSHATAWSGTHDKQAVSAASNYYYNDASFNVTHTHNTAGSGEGHTHTLSSHTHEVTPPYLAVYMWKRVA